MAGISIPIQSDVRDFIKGTDDVEKALDGVADSLDDLAKDAKPAASKMGRELSGETEDAGRDAERSLERVETSFRELADTASRETRQAGDSMARETRDGARRGGEAVRELGDEAKQNASETFSSFDGSIDGLLDGIQGTFGGVMSNLGPLGMAAGAAAAIGIGLISNAVQAGADYTEDMKEKVSELTQELIDAGVEGGPGLDFIIGKLQDLAGETDDAATDLEDLRDAADRSGSSYKDLAQAYAGSAEELDNLVDSNKEHLKALQDEADAIDTTTNAGVEKYSQLMDQIAGQEQYNAYLGESKKVADEAAQAEQNYAEAGGPAMEAKQARIEALNAAYDDIVGGVDEFVNAETGVFDVAAYLAAMEARTQALQDYQKSLNESGLTEEAKAFLDEQGQEAAAAMLAGYTSGSDAQKAALNDLWSEAGSESSGSFNTTFTEGMPDEVPGPTVTVEADTKAADAAIKKTVDEKREAKILVVTDMKQARADIDAFVKEKRTASVSVSLDLTDANNQMSTFLNRTRTTTITANVVDRNGKKVD